MTKFLLVALALLVLVTTPAFTPPTIPVVVGDAAWQSRWADAMLLLDGDDRWFVTTFVNQVRQDLPHGVFIYKTHTALGYPDDYLGDQGKPERALWDAVTLIHAATHSQAWWTGGDVMAECGPLRAQGAFLRRKAATLYGRVLARTMEWRAGAVCGGYE